MKEILKVYTEVGSGENDPIFRGGISISEYTYSSTTFNVVKQLSATLYHNECLDDFWTGNEYVSFKGTRYYIRKVPTWTLEDTDTRYKYDIQFISEAKILEDVYWYDTYTAGYATYYSESTKITFIGDIKQFVARMNAALSKSIIGGGWTVVLADSLKLESKLISMDSMYFSDALKYMYDTYGIPYYIVGKTIYVGFPTVALPFTFEFGANKGLYGLTKTQANFRPITRITGIGSTENIPYYYPNLSGKREEVENWIEPQTNLMPPLFRTSVGKEKFYNALNNTYLLPDSTTEYYNFNNIFNPKAPSEHKQPFDDIKPSIQGMTYDSLPIDIIKSVAYDTDDNDNIDAETGDVEHPYFKVTLNPLGFDLFKSASARGEMTIKMNSGSCGVCEFRVMVDESKIINGDYTDSTNNSITLILEKDLNTYDTILPNQQLKVKAGDKFVILYIDLPQSYITFAETKLYNAIIKHLAENNKERFNFSAKFDEKLLRLKPEIENQIAENTLIPIKYESGGKNADGTPKYITINLNVQNITIKCVDDAILTSYEIGLTDNVSITTNSIDNVNDKIDIVDKVVIGNKKNNDEQIRRNIKALKDAEKYLFDTDGKIKEERLSAKIIEGLIGIYGTDSGAYYLNNVKLLTNIQGKPNSINFSGGTLHHYLIKWGIEDTNNNFIWNITPIVKEDLISAQNYYIYIQANRSNNSAIWLISTNQLQYDINPNVYYFLVGNLLPTENGYRSQTFQKGLTYINGGDIKAGTISSFDGSLIFDLDRKLIEAKNGAEIRGKITFTSGSSGLTNLTEWDGVDNTLTGLREDTDDANLLAAQATLAANNAQSTANGLTYLKQAIPLATSVQGGLVLSSIVGVGDTGVVSDASKIQSFMSGLTSDRLYFGADDTNAYNRCVSFADKNSPYDVPIADRPAFCVYKSKLDGKIKVYIRDIDTALLDRAAVVHTHENQLIRPLTLVVPKNAPIGMASGEYGLYGNAGKNIDISIFSKIRYDAAIDALIFDCGFVSRKFVSAKGVSPTGGSGGGGLIQRVYKYTELGGTFNDSLMTDTFNAYTVNKLHTRISTLESGTSSVSWGTGDYNYIPLTVNAVSKNISLYGHTHSQYALSTLLTDYFPKVGNGIASFDVSGRYCMVNNKGYACTLTNGSTSECMWIDSSNNFQVGRLDNDGVLNLRGSNFTANGNHLLHINSSSDRLLKNQLIGGDANVSLKDGLRLLCNITGGVNYPSDYTSGLSVVTDYVGFQLMTYGGDTSEFYFRKRLDGSTGDVWRPWWNIWHSGNSNKSDIDWTCRRIVTNNIYSNSGVTDISFFTLENGAQNINIGSLLVSNNYADRSLVPANGIYSRGIIQSDGYRLLDGFKGMFKMRDITNDYSVGDLAFHNDNGSLVLFENVCVDCDSIGAGYNEGIRLIKRFNNWTNINFGCDRTTSGTNESTQWIIGSDPSNNFKIVPGSFHGSSGLATRGITMDRLGNTNISGNVTVSGVIQATVGIWSPGYVSARKIAPTSDRRLKCQIKPLRSSLQYVLDTSFVEYDWKSDGKHDIGLIAQDEEIREFGFLVGMNGNGDKNIEYPKYIAILGKSIQEMYNELKRENIQLRQEIDQLKNDIQN